MWNPKQTEKMHSHIPNRSNDKYHNFLCTFFSLWISNNFFSSICTQLHLAFAEKKQKLQQLKGELEKKKKKQFIATLSFNTITFQPQSNLCIGVCVYAMHILYNNDNRVKGKIVAYTYICIYWTYSAAHGLHVSDFVFFVTSNKYCILPRIRIYPIVLRICIRLPSNSEILTS